MDPTSVIGLSHPTPVVPHTDRMKRHHTQENWSLSFLEFDNGVGALMVYSNVAHARSLGRKQTGVDEIDGTAGSIVDGAVYVVPREELKTGAQGQAVDPVRELETVEVLCEVRYGLPEGPIVWENPFDRYPLREGQVAVADELLSIANAVRGGRGAGLRGRGRAPGSGALAVNAPVQLNRETVRFSLPDETEVERNMHRWFEEEFGHAWDNMDGLIDVFYPRR